MNHPRVALGVIHPGSISASFWNSETSCLFHEMGRGELPYYRLLNRCASGRIVDARNEVAAAFLDDTKADWLWFVDSDMCFPEDTLERLLKAAHPKTRPVVGALCFGLRREHTDPLNHAERFRCFPTVYVWREFEDRVGFQVVTDYPRDELVAVSASGAACVLIHRSVMTKIRDLYGDHWFTQVTHPTGPTTFSEDMSFFIRAAAADAPVFVHTGVKTAHDKGGVFLDETVWDGQQASVLECV